MIAGEKLAALANLTKRRLYQLAEQNKIPPATNGQFPMLASITALFAFYQRDGEQIQQEKLLKLTAERKTVELRLAKEKGLMMPVEVARCQNARAWGFVFENLQRAENELPPALAGLDSISIFERLHSFTERMRRDAQEKFEKAA